MARPPGRYSPKGPPRDACPDCGARVRGGREGCQRLFEQVLVREYSDPQAFRIHRLTGDAYSLQHPDRYCRSAKPMAAHLTGLCWVFEYHWDPNVGKALSRWLDGPLAVERVSPPAFRGDLDILHVYNARGPEEHAQRVQEWARSVWDAWAEHHETARQWVRAALGTSPGSAS